MGWGGVYSDMILCVLCVCEFSEVGVCDTRCEQSDPEYFKLLLK